MRFAEEKEEGREREGDCPAEQQLPEDGRRRRKGLFFRLRSPQPPRVFLSFYSFLLPGRGQSTALGDYGRRLIYFTACCLPVGHFFSTLPTALLSILHAFFRFIKSDVRDTLVDAQ